jgi:hypothetical protein
VEDGGLADGNRGRARLLGKHLGKAETARGSPPRHSRSTLRAPPPASPNSPAAHQVEHPHEEVELEGVADGPHVPVDAQLVRHRHNAPQAQGAEHAGAEGAVVGGLEVVGEGDRDDGRPRHGRGDEVEVAPEGLAQEGVVDGRVEGRDDEDRDAGVVKAPHHLADVALAAAQQVADARGEQAHARAGEVDVHRPARHGPLHDGRQLLLQLRVEGRAHAVVAVGEAVLQVGGLGFGGRAGQRRGGTSLRRTAGLGWLAAQGVAAKRASARGFGAAGRPRRRIL